MQRQTTLSHEGLSADCSAPSDQWPSSLRVIQHIIFGSRAICSFHESVQLTIGENVLSLVYHKSDFFQVFTHTLNSVHTSHDADFCPVLGCLEFNDSSRFSRHLDHNVYDISSIVNRLSRHQIQLCILVHSPQAIHGINFSICFILIPLL